MMKLIHGNCLTELPKLATNSIDLVLTDPPYGNNVEYIHGKGKRTIMGDENPLVSLAAIAATYRVLKRNAVCFCFTDVKHIAMMHSFVRDYTDYKNTHTLVWDKVNIGMGFGFRHRYEMILVLEKGKPKFNSNSLANVLTHKRLYDVKAHPHMKPVELLQGLIEHASKPGDTVLDPFMGSGSTGVACQALGRKFIGMEQEKHYHQVAQARIYA
jgi:site-specific DNA-methyltransferase (adenine-specific)